MLDSESQLREAIQKMLNPATAAATPEHAQQRDASAPPRSKPAPRLTSYVCPMPEHATIKYDHSGKCPICGMTLIPLR